MVLNRLHGVVQLIWRAGELPHLVHLVILMERLSQYSWDLGRGMLPVPVYSAAGGGGGTGRPLTLLGRPEELLGSAGHLCPEFKN